MKWAHLPVAGGLYDQDPRFIEAMMIIFSRRGEIEREKAKAEERKNHNASKPSKVARARRR